MRWIARLGMVATTAALAWAPVVAHGAPEESDTSASAAEIGDGTGESGLTVAGASADSDGGSAEAHPVGSSGGPTAGGTAEEGSGGVDTAEHNPEGTLGRAQIMAWEAQAGSLGAESSTVLLRLTINNEAEGDVAELALLQSSASESPAGSQASSDAARLSLGGGQLEVTLLHAEASDASGTTYVLGINEHKVITDEDAAGSCVIEVPGAVRIECLKVVAASGEALAEMGRVSGGDDQFAASVFAAQSSPATVQTAAGGFTSPTSFDSGELDRSFDDGGFAGALARTGIDIIPLAVAGLLLLVTGGLAMVGTRNDAAG